MFLFLIMAYLSSYLVDIINIFGLRSQIEASGKLSVPLIWDYLFTDGGPVEILQWLLLGLFVMTAGYLAGKLETTGETKKASFWMIMSLTGFLMLIEDAGNLRHFLSHRVVLLFFDGMTPVMITEVTYFILLGSIPIYGLFRYGRFIRNDHRTVLFLFLTLVFYGSAVLMSGTRDIMFWYQTAGDVLYQWTASLGGEDLLRLYEETDAYLAEIQCISLSYWFMDYLIEESLELLGASFFLASALSSYQGLKIKRNF